MNFPLDDYQAKGDRNLTRYNAEGVDLNRDHVAKVQPETRALNDNVMRKYRIDYMIDLHHQGTRSERDGELVSGFILYPTTPNADPAVVEKSKQLGAVVFEQTVTTLTSTAAAIADTSFWDTLDTRSSRPGEEADDE